jgi:hypothetical protein
VAVLASMLITGSTPALAAQSSCTPTSPGACISLNGAAGVPTGGVIAISFPPTSSSATGVDAFQAEVAGAFQPASIMAYVPGAYVLSFSNCSGGSAAGGTYLVGNASQYPAPPADALGTAYGALNSPLAFSADSAGGSLACDFSVVTAGTLPPATLAIPNDVFLFFGDGTSTSLKKGVACGPPTAGGSGEVSKNIDTNSGCDNSNGTAAYPVTGFITIHVPSSSPQATGVDAFQAKPSQSYVSGSYTISFTNCTGGAASNGAYQIGSGNQFPTPPTHASGTTYRASTSPLSFTATTAGGSVSCAYSITTTGTLPADSVSMTNDIFVFFSDGTSGQFASQSVKPFIFSSPVVPESPQVALFALAGVAASVGVAGVAGLRRRQHLSEQARPR